jgi:arylformamidase
MDLEVARIIDISPVISPRLGVFPGDVPFAQKVAMDFGMGDHLKLSAVTTTLHIGAHADAPSHYEAGGANIADVALRPYLGLCEVVTADVAAGQVVDRSHLPRGFLPRAPRILFRTGTFPNPEEWNSGFAGIRADLVDWLADQQVVLVGIDTPSIDPESSKTLDAHRRVAARGLRVLEGLVLDHVQDGCYQLIAMPLAIENADASPVRAVLLG